MIHTRHTRWSKCGVWQRVFQALAQEADNEYAMIDSTIVRAHQHSASAKKEAEETQAIERSRQYRAIAIRHDKTARNCVRWLEQRGHGQPPEFDS